MAKHLQECHQGCYNLLGVLRCRAQVGNSPCPCIFLAMASLSLLGSARVLTPSPEQASHLSLPPECFNMDKYAGTGSMNVPLPARAYLPVLLLSALCELMK